MIFIDALNKCYESLDNNNKYVAEQTQQCLDSIEAYINDEQLDDICSLAIEQLNNAAEYVYTKPRHGDLSSVYN